MGQMSDCWLDLAGKVGVVTGGGGGIGRAIAQSLAQQGCQIAVVDIDLPRAEETASLIQDEKGLATAYCADITDPESVATVAQNVATELGNCLLYTSPSPRD